MKIAIHHREGSFSNRWIAYCEQNNIAYKVVNAFDSDIIQQLKDCEALMWHHHHNHVKDVLAARNILFALEHAGVKVFPDFKTAWHFDDKVAQKYLLEAIGAPLVPSYVFYDKKQALEWAWSTSYPKVFKLKGGAGATNVKLVKTEREAIQLINQAFGKGFAQFDRFANLQERIRKFKVGQENFTGILKGLVRLFITTNFAKQQAREKGYIYFQDFIPNNDSDIRVIIVADKAFAIKRMVRENDFRASGSGHIIYDQQQIDIKIIKLVFQVNEKIKSSCIAFDFVVDQENNPLIIEISYGFSIHAYDLCSGYWDNRLNWHNISFNPQEWMLKDLQGVRY